jgi:hypothetical protein
VVVISDALWKRRFGASPDAIGRKLRIDDDWYTVIGVAPESFRHPGRSLRTDVEMWAPAGFVAAPFPSPSPRGAYQLRGAVARLKPGLTVAQAQQRLDAFAAQMRAEHPADYPARAGWVPKVIPLQAHARARAREERSAALDLVAQLFDQFQHDPALVPAVRAELARLRIATLRAAQPVPDFPADRAPPSYE